MVKKKVVGFLAKQPAPASNKKKAPAKKAAAKKAGAIPKPPKGDQRADYEYNHEVIKKGFVELIKKLKRKPTLIEIADHTGLAKKTVQRHMDNLKFEPAKHPLRILTDDVILAIYQSANSGKAQAQKLWMQVFENFEEKIKTDVTSGGEKIQHNTQVIIENPHNTEAS